MSAHLPPPLRGILGGCSAGRRRIGRDPIRRPRPSGAASPEEENRHEVVCSGVPSTISTRGWRRRPPRGIGCSWCRPVRRPTTGLTGCANGDRGSSRSSCGTPRTPSTGARPAPARRDAGRDGRRGQGARVASARRAASRGARLGACWTSRQATTGASARPRSPRRSRSIPEDLDRRRHVQQPPAQPGRQGRAARTEWPRYEVLAVDNGSTDGTPHLLAEFSRAHTNLRVIALPENRGFPRPATPVSRRRRGTRSSS